VQKWHFRYKTSDISEMSQSYYRVSIETRVRPIDWLQIWWPSVSSNLRGQGHVWCTSVLELIIQEQITVGSSNLEEGLTM